MTGEGSFKGSVGRSRSGQGLVVVVNDEPSMLKSAKMWLEQEGVRVLTFADARTALEASWLNDANLLITDYTNPPLGGVGLWHALRARGVTTPVAFLSAWATEVEEMFATAEDRPVAYVELPCSFRELATTVKALVRQDQAVDR